MYSVKENGCSGDISSVACSLLPGQGFSQCFTGTNCTGGEVVALDKRDCCVGTDDGLSFHDGSNCSLCVGK